MRMLWGDPVAGRGASAGYSPVHLPTMPRDMRLGAFLAYPRESSTSRYKAGHQARADKGKA